MDTLSRLVFNILPPIRSERLERYSSGNIVMFKATNIFKGPFSIDNYVFLIPYFENLSFIIDRKKFILNPNMLLPVEPGRTMCASDDSDVQAYMVLVINKDFVRNICQSIYGKINVSFQNDSYIIGEDILGLISLFIMECKNIQPGHELIIESLSTQIVVSILRYLKGNISVELNKSRYNEMNGVKKVIDFMTDNFNKEFSYEAIAKIANFSPYHFIRVFKSQTGKTPYEYLLDVKIEKAQELLRINKYNITEVSYLCGFNSLNHFSTVFKKKAGVSPNGFRKIVT